jgi:hypothetical protein
MKMETALSQCGTGGSACPGRAREAERTSTFRNKCFTDSPAVENIIENRIQLSRHLIRLFFLERLRRLFVFCCFLFFSPAVRRDAK